MAAKKGGLGKGLSALLSENSIESNDSTVTLRLSEISPNRDQPRKQFDDAALAELADSIAKHGVLQPLLVRPLAAGGYQIVAGERRYRAARMAGLSEVPVIVRDLTDQEADELALIENLQREDLNPIEEAVGYRTLMDRYGLTQDQAAKAVGKSRPAVANALRLLNLPEKVLLYVQKGELSAGHARAVLAFDTEAEQIAVAERIIAEDLSVRAVEKLAQNAKKEPGGGKVSKQNKFYNEVELALAEQTARRIKVIAGKKGGVLQIPFFSDDDLQAIANKLGDC